MDDLSEALACFEQASAMGLAELHAALGHREEALRWLEYEPRHAWWAGFLSLPVYEFLHDEPRYQALVRLVNPG